MVAIEVRSSDRASIVGMTGSGKTFLAGYLLRTARRLVVIDPKGTLRGRWRLEEWSEATRKRLLDGEPVRIRLARPVTRGPSRIGPGQTIWDDYLWDIYDAGNVLVYIDEMYGVTPVGGRIPEPLQAIYTRGRELGIGAISASQRPSWVPLEILSESTWFFCFRLQLEDDRRRMAGLMGAEVLEPIPDLYGFWTYQAGWPYPVYTEQLEVRRERAAAAGG